MADLIRYRLQRERLVRRVAHGRFPRVGASDFTSYAYASDVDNAVHVALVKGDVGGPRPVLTRVHRACLAGDVLGSASCDCGAQLQLALKRINDEGRGVLVYLQKDLPARARLRCTHVSNEAAVPGQKDQTRLREFGVGAQILKDLGLSRLRLLTNNPKKIVGLESYDIEVVEQVALKPVVALAARSARPKAAKRRPRALD